MYNADGSASDQNLANRKVVQEFADQLIDRLRAEGVAAEIEDCGEGIFGLMITGPDREPINVSMVIQQTE